MYIYIYVYSMLYFGWLICLFVCSCVTTSTAVHSSQAIQSNNIRLDAQHINTRKACFFCVTAKIIIHSFLIEPIIPHA